MTGTPTHLRNARIALAMLAAATGIAVVLRLAGILPARSLFVLADLRYLFLAEAALLLLVWRLSSRSAEPDPAEREPLRGYLAAAVPVVTACLIVYWRDLGVPFWDSDDWVLMYGFRWILQGDAADRFGQLVNTLFVGTRPTGFSDILKYMIQFGLFAGFGTNPLGYHGFALCVHAANCVLVMLLARRLGFGVRSAAAAGLFMALFPPDHEVITLAPFFNFGLVTTFMLLACLALPPAGLPKPWGRRGAACVFATLALLTKESAVALPLFAFLVLAAEDDAGLAVAWRRHRGTVAPLAILSAVYLAVALVMAAAGPRADVEWNTTTADALHAGFWTRPAGVWDLLAARLPVNLFTPLTHDLFPATFPWAAAALAAGLAIAIAILGWTPPPRRWLVPLCIAWAVLTPAVAGPLVRYPVAFLEKTHYFYPASAALALGAATLFGRGVLGALGPRRRAIMMTLFAALLAFNVYTLSAVIDVRVWFGGVVARSIEVFTSEYARLPPGDQVYIVCDDERLDRGGAEPIVFANALRNRLDKPVHLIAHVDLAPPDADPTPDAAGPVTISFGPGSHVFGWDRRRDDFVAMDPEAVVQLAAAQRPKKKAGPFTRRIVFESAEGRWEMEGEVHENITPQEITRRM